MMFRPFQHLSLNIAVLAGLALGAMAKDVTIECEISPQQIYIGESARLTVRVDGFKEGMDPDFSKIADCSLEFMGQSDRSFRNISIVNGRREVTGFSGRIFQYDVTPSRAGTHRIGPISVGNADDVVTVSGPRLTVEEVAEQDRVVLLLDASKHEVIVDETFSVRLRVMVQALSPPYNEASPLPAEQPPHLRVPYLESDAFEGLEGPDIHKLLNGMLVSNGRTPALAINNYTVESNPFADFFSMRSLRDRKQPARFNIKSHTVDYNGKRYHQYPLTLHYVPTAEGSYTFGPVAFKGQIFVGATPQGEGLTRQIYAVTEALTVRVIPPPEDGRPASFVGAIGEGLNASASLDAQTCRVGDPLTLELNISGEIRLDNLFAPRLELQENLSNDFRIYEDTVQSTTENGARIYRYTVRPTRAGTLEFPPVAVSFYNTAMTRYDTVWTSPIPLRANPAAEVEDSIVIDTAEQSVTIVASSADPNLSVAAPIAPLTDRPTGDAIFDPLLHGALFALGPLIFLLGVAIRASRRLLPAAAKRQRQATAAQSATIKIHEATQGTEAAAARHRIAAAMREYVSSRLGIEVAALTPGELNEELLRHSAPPYLAKQFTDLVEQNLNSGFQASSDTPADLSRSAAEASKVVRQIDEALRPEGRMPKYVRQWLSLGLVLIMTQTTVLADTGAESFERQLAMSEIMTADQPDEFDRAAQAFERVLVNDTPCGTTLYNYGTALLMAGNYEPAMAALIRAERYMGTTWELQRNMQLAARGMQDGLGETRLAWYRAPLFWHYGLPGRTRLTIAAVAFLGVWVALLLRITGFRAAYRIAVSFAAVLLILFGSSAATTLYQELRASQQTHVAPGSQPPFLQMENTP
jgi:tetratricopeptide (TPR) repeat protein